MKKNSLTVFSVFMLFLVPSFFGCNIKHKNSGQPAETIISSKKKYQNFCASADNYLSENNFTGSVLIAKNKHIIFAKGYGKCDSKDKKSEQNTINTVFETGSLTKQMTASAILQLNDKNKLKLEDTIDSYFPDFEKGSNITIRMLLNMRSGLTDHINAGAEFFPVNIFRAIEANQIKCKPVDENLVLKWLPESPMVAAPGSTYFYSNTNYYLLAKIIEAETKKPFHHYMKKNILKKSRMNNSNFDFQNTDAKGYSGGKYYSIPAGLSLGCGDLNSSVMDLYNWNCSFWSGKIVPKKYLRQLKKARGYNYGFYCGNGMVFHAGNTNVFNSYSSYNFKNKVQIIVLSNMPSAECNATKIAGELNNRLR